ncbi:hypothetical protein ACFL3V_03750 [Nanoarchaeota archaeon]
METKQQVTAKFIIGMVLIIVSLILGKLVLVPILIFPGSETWRVAMVIAYAFSWILILVGIWLAGVEGYRLATHKYKVYQKKTIHRVKRHSKNAVNHTKNAARKTKKVTKNAARKTKKVTKKAAKETVRVLKKPGQAMSKKK